MYDGDAGFILKNAAKEAAKSSGVAETEAWRKTNYAWFRYQVHIPCASLSICKIDIESFFSPIME